LHGLYFFCREDGKTFFIFAVKALRRFLIVLTPIFIFSFYENTLFLFLDEKKQKSRAAEKKATNSSVKGKMK